MGARTIVMKWEGCSHQAATQLSFTGAFPLSVVAMFCVNIRIELQGASRTKMGYIDVVE